jgi:hypothetical protein
MCLSSVPPAVAPSFHNCLLVLMGETLLATVQGELPTRCGGHRFVSLPLPITGPLIDSSVAWPFQHKGRHPGLFDTLSASAADSAVPKTDRPWTSTTTANS